MNDSTVSTSQLSLPEPLPLPEPESSIWSILAREARGRENAIPMSDLAAHLGLSTRDLQAAVQRLIADFGKPVGSSCGKINGFYVIIDQADLDATFNNRVRRALSNLRIAYKLKRSPQVAAALGQVSLLDPDQDPTTSTFSI